MQKFLLIVSVFTILPIFECIVAKNIELPITEITLNYQDEYQIPVISAEPELLTYTVVEKQYVATVSPSGLIKAGKVGTTWIKISDGENSKYLKVSVKPRFNLYPDPILSFGINKIELMADLGAPYFIDNDTNIYLYLSNSKNVNIIGYRFDEMDKLSGVWVDVNMGQVAPEDLVAFLVERYSYIGNEGSVQFVHKLNDTHDMLVGIEVSSPDEVTVLYFTDKR